MTRLDEIRELYGYNAWAMRRIFECAAQLTEEELHRDLGGSFGSVRDTLVHIVGAEWVWLTRWQGSSPTAIPNTRANLAHGEIVTWWHQIDEEREAFLVALPAEALDRVIGYTNFSGIYCAFPLWQMLRHVVIHSSYHRGQVTTLLRQLGHNSVATDILIYHEMQRPLEA